MFFISDKEIDISNLKKRLIRPEAGAFVSFEGWVRNHNEGEAVRFLEYETYDRLAENEAKIILEEAKLKFNFFDAICVHRKGHLNIGDLAVWIGVNSAHRKEAFLACQYLIDEIKHRLPVWKKEHYINKPSKWVACHQCANPKPELTEDIYYSKQTKIPSIQSLGQKKLKNSKVLIVGIGGLGCPAATYLTTAGVGHISLCDFDAISGTNLHRQTLYSSAEIGELKVNIAQNKLSELNPFVRIEAISKKLTRENVSEIIKNFDIVLDASDNFETRFLIHDTCYSKKIPLVQAAIHQFEGQIQTFNFDDDSGCLRCIWPDLPEEGCVGNCIESGTLGVVPGVLGTYQANETIKLLLGLSSPSTSSTILVDLLSLEYSKIKRLKNPICPLCNLNDRKENQSIPVDKLIYKESWEIDFFQSKNYDDLCWIDLRNPSEVDLTHIKENELRKATQLDFYNSNDINNAKKYLFVCQRGHKSKHFVQKLRTQGSKHVYSLFGGISALSINDLNLSDSG